MKSSSYESPKDWSEQVLSLFPAATDGREIDFSTPPTGTNEEQDILWRWVEGRVDRLQWNPSTGKYDLAPAPTLETIER